MPNAFAYLMLLAWPMIAMAIFRRLPVYKALIWTMLIGYLVLPSATTIKIPMIPAFDKHSIPAITAFILCRIHAPPANPASQQNSIFMRMIIMGLLVLLIGSPLLTVLANSDPMPIGPTFLPGLRLYDAMNMISGTVISILPFLLAIRHLNTTEAHNELLRAFVICGLYYSLPAMVEIQLSPQLHTWIYGFFPHEFLQHIRAGGFRPILFLSHGLMVGMFFCLSILAALALWHEAKRSGQPAANWMMAALWLTVTLVLVKSIGALAIALGLGLITAFLGQRMQVLLALSVAIVVMFYPILRGANYIPVDAIHDLTLSYSADRAQSLKFRLDNEDELLAHANEKPLTGWGAWGRNHIYDPETGRMTSVTDGIWIILIGVNGWLGYIANFGLLTLPIVMFARHRRRFGPSLITPGLLILLSAILIDFLPNAGLVPYVWMIAGGIVGFALQPSAAMPNATPESVQKPDFKLRPILT